MKKAALITGILSLMLSTSVFSEESKVGYKDFYLGQTRQAVKNLIKGKYSNVTFSANRRHENRNRRIGIFKAIFRSSEYVVFIYRSR